METPFPGGNRITEGFVCRLTQHAAQQKTKTQQPRGNQTISEQNPFTKPGVSTKHGETTEALCGDGAVGEYLRLCSLFPMIVQTGAGSQCQSWIVTSLSPSSLAHTSSHCLTKAGQTQSTLRHHSPCLAHLQHKASSQGISCAKYSASCLLQLKPASRSWQASMSTQGRLLHKPTSSRLGEVIVLPNSQKHTQTNTMKGQKDMLQMKERDTISEKGPKT